MQDAVWRDGASGGRWKDVFTGRLLLYLPQQFYRVSSYRDVTVGIFRFQRGFHYCSILPQDLALDADNSFIQVNVAPFESQQLTAPQAGGKVNIVQLEHPAALCFFEECVKAVQRKNFPFLLLQ